jgi:DNA ligase (NAD+)
VGRLTHFASRGGLDIEGLGERTARQLVETGLVAHLPDLFDLTSEDFERLEGYAEVSARKLAQAVRDAGTPDLARFLYALGVPEVGAAVARELARYFGTIERIREADVDTLVAVDGIGEVMARQIHDFFAEPRNARVLDALLDGRVRPGRNEETSRSGALEGLTFVFTGTLHQLSRGQAQELVVRHGGKATGSVSGHTSYLVAGDGGGSKLDKARREGVAVLDEEGFMGLLAELGIEVEVGGA